MSDRYFTVNKFLVDVFNEVLGIEEKCLSLSKFSDLSVKEMHVIDAVCAAERSGENRAADIAAALGITPGTLTVSTSILERKGYLLRKGDSSDKRVVRLTSTDKGRAANEHHASFHHEMVDEVLRQLSEEQQEIFVEALGRVISYFKTKQKENRHG